MGRKEILVTLFAIFFLVMPVATTAQEITNGSDYVFECPMRHQVSFPLTVYGITDFAFDNFTIEKLMLNISATSLLDIRVSALNRLSDFNYTFVEVYRTNATQSNIEHDDLYKEQETFNSSYWASRFSNSTHVIDTRQYYYQAAYFIVNIENIGTEDTFIEVDKSLTIQTYGDREVELNVTLRDRWDFIFPTTNKTFPTTQSTNPFNTLPILDRDTLLKVLVGLFIMGGCVGALIVMVSQTKWNI